MFVMAIFTYSEPEPAKVKVGLSSLEFIFESSDKSIIPLLKKAGAISKMINDSTETVVFSTNGDVNSNYVNTEYTFVNDNLHFYTITYDSTNMPSVDFFCEIYGDCVNIDGNTYMWENESTDIYARFVLSERKITIGRKLN